MNKKSAERLAPILFLLAGIMFIISAVIDKNYTYVALGACFIVLSIVFGVKDKNKPKDKDRGDK